MNRRLTRISSPTHTEPVFNMKTLPVVVKWAKKHAGQLKAEAIVGCGHSGLIVGSILAYEMKIPFVAIRRPTDTPVAGGKGIDLTNFYFNYGKHPTRFVIVDDCVATGGTFRNMLKALNRNLVFGNTPQENFPVGLLLYNDWCNPYFVETMAKRLNRSVVVKIRGRS